jgi:predicted dehydrogenase
MTLRFGVAGTGHWAHTVHVPGLERTGGAKPIGLWGRNAAEAERIASEHDLAVFEDFDAMLEAVDAISFALPPDVQAPLALRAARAGKHLLLEKPIARNVREADAVAREVAARGLGSVVFFMRRFVPEIAAAIDQASRRPWTHASVTVYATTLAAGSPYADSAWRREAGAAVWDIGPHVVAILIAVLGRVVEVRAERVDNRVHRFTTTHASGATADVSLSIHAEPSAARNDYRFEDGDASITLPDPAFDRPAIYAIAAGELVRNVADRSSPHRCDAAFGAEVVAVLEAVERRRASAEMAT